MDTPFENRTRPAGPVRGVAPWRGFAFWLVVVLVVLAEGAARLWGPAMPSCAKDRRNPYRYRGWPEYVEGAQTLAASNRLVVVLTNCQGYGAELPGRGGFPAVLQALLAERQLPGDGSWKVANWALDGGISIEYTILAAYLQTLKPDLVVASLAFADFRAEQYHDGYRHSRSDVPRLATRPAVFRHLPGPFVHRHGKVEDSLDAWVFDHCALLRVKEYGWSWLEGHLPGIHQALYAPAINYRPWRIEGLRSWTREFPALRPASGGEPYLVYDERSVTMLDEFVAILAAVDAPVVLVAQPNRDPHPGAAQFAQDLTGSAARHGLPCWNLQDLIPFEEYRSSNHLNHRGHRRLARELADRIEAWLAPGAEGKR